MQFKANNFFLPLSHSLSSSDTHTHTHLHRIVSCCSVKHCISLVVMIENSLIARSEDKHAPLNLSDYSSSSPRLSAEDEQRIFPLFSRLNSTQSSPISSPPCALYSCQPPDNLPSARVGFFSHPPLLENITRS